MEIRPFAIHVWSDQLSDLEERLNRSRLPPHFDDQSWDYGPPAAFLGDLREYWLDRYRWRDTEAVLNRCEQFLASSGGVNIHFFRMKQPNAKRAILLTHGWPGSAVEFLEVGERLAHPLSHAESRHEPFDVIIPSLPGFGFSSAPPQARFNMRDIAQQWHALMQALGYGKYFVHGSDIGAGVSTWLARLYPHSVIGLHLNYVPGSFAPFIGPQSAPLSVAERDWLEGRNAWQEAEGAYSHLQSTKPMSLAYGLTDSPLGLAAWISEKYHGWTDTRAGVLGRLTLDQLLTTVCWYWFSNDLASTLRIYRENKAAPLRMNDGEVIRPPLSFAHFPAEIGVPPPDWVRRGYNLVRWTSMDFGGHFPALEAPAQLCLDIQESFQSSTNG